MPKGVAEGMCMRCLLEAGMPDTVSISAADQSINLTALPGIILDGKYRIEQLLGQGGMGAVFLATHLGTTRTVAVKVIVPRLAGQDEFLLRFQREAEAAGRLRHPNVVNVTDFGITSMGSEPLAYLVMEYLDGETLAGFLRKNPLPPRDLVLDIIDQVALGLDAAHAAGIVHRDLKPDNIWLESNRRGGYNIKVLDFGIAKLNQAAGTAVAVGSLVPGATDPEAATLIIEGPKEPNRSSFQTPPHLKTHDMASASASLQTTVGSVLGTPAFMAPEQCQGLAVDHRADIYSLGVIAYELFCGRLPFQAKSLRELLALQVNAKPPVPRSLDKSIPTGVSIALMQALEKDAEARPNSAAMLAAQLRAGVDGEVHILAQGKIFANNYSKCFAPLLAILFCSLIPMMALLFNLASLIETRKLVPGGVLLAMVDLGGFTIHLFLSQLYKAAATMVLEDAATIGYFRPRTRVILTRLLKGLGPMLGMFGRTVFRLSRSGFLEGALWPVVWAAEGLTGGAALRRSRQLAETQPSTTLALVARQYGLLLAATLALTAVSVWVTGSYAESARALFSERRFYGMFICYPIPLSAIFLTFGTACDFLYRSARRCLGETFVWALPSGTRGDRKGSAPRVRPGTIVSVVPASLIIAVVALSPILHTQPPTRLFDAVRDGRVGAVLKAIDSGIPVESRDVRDLTALAVAATQGRVELVRALLDRGANVNIRFSDGSTPLMLALANGHAEAARVLIERHADVRVVDSDGRTPLMIAAMHGDAAMCRLLLQSGADAARRDESGKTARDYAVEENHRDVVGVLDELRK